MNFLDLCKIYGVEPDRKGEAHIDCPNCGKKAQKGQTHFSFNKKGGYCFVCRYKCGLNQLAKEKGIEISPQKRYPKKKEDRYYRWKDKPELYLREYTRHKDKYKRWQEYKPLLKGVINRHQLGYGVLPMSQCKHFRLIVPVFRKGKIVDFRGRAVSCDCIKWLSPAGMKLKELTLYNYKNIKKGSTVMLVENPIDALLISQFTEYCGVATYSTAFWNNEWILQLKLKQPSKIVVALDNDLGGNGGAKSREKQISEWKTKNPSCTHIPDAYGPKIVNRLKPYFQTYLYDWKNAEPKMDFGKMFEGSPKLHSPYNYT